MSSTDHMLAVPSTGASNLPAQDFRRMIESGDWVADVKLDGIRSYLLWDGEKIQFRNRNSVDITKRYPELARIGDLLGPDPVWLDGEIVATDGKFETALTRDKQTITRSINRLAELHPCRFVAFDMPSLHRSSYVERRTALEAFVMFRHPLLDVTVTSEDPGFLDLTREQELEGVIAKRKVSRYDFGKRSRSWVKFKNTHRISCLVAGYTPGNGSRADFGAMHLALIDDSGQVVSVGRVGTGFSGYEIRELKARLDQGDLLVAEIECLNVTSGGTLRFPVYKGIRVDVALNDCTTRQLETLPTCAEEIA